ncbi:MAG TPA: TetR/AcrR family transcriptional regulator [Acidimicrobiia bacterium]|nr:TetR/AcrR family transcriptional regulator [Acidimicrobiia bacterium]
MTPAERIRAEAKAATRQALLQAGLEETVEAGGEFPSIEKLCARAGYTRGAFYVYFTDRDHFLEEMLDWVLSDIIRALFDSTTEGDADIHEIVRRFDAALATGDWPDIHRNIRTGYLAVLREARSGTPIGDRHSELMLGVLARLRERIAEGQQQGTVRADVDARDVAALMLLIAIGGICWTGLGILDADSGALGAILLQLLNP